MNSWKIIVLMTVAVLMLAGCKDYDEEVVVSADLVRVKLAYTFSSVADSPTRQSDDVVTNPTIFRLPQNPMVVIPMVDQNPQPSGITWNEPVEKDGAGENLKSLLYYSSYCNMLAGVNGCLVYGSVENLASGAIPSKVYNGSLTANNTLTSIASKSDMDALTFSLESIYGNTTAPNDATTLAGYLNTLAGVTGWSTSDNSILKNLFENFTGHGSALPGSAISVKKWIEALKNAANYYLENLPSSIENGVITILNNIVNTAEGITYSDLEDVNYPRGLYLPDGAAALRWTGSAFQPAMQTTTLDNINSVSRFAYPAPLFFFVESSIMAAEELVDFATLYADESITTEASKTAWEKVLENAKFKKTVVTPKTKSVALEDPVQYAVAQLKLTVKAEPTEENGTSIKDNAGTDIEIANFPLTGVIVCGQRPVNYRFEQGSNSDADVKFIYDSQVNTNGSDYYYLTTSDPEGGPNTLVLQSFDGEDVNIILEFENQGTQEFRCASGYVYPGTRFYLIGKVKADSGEGGDEASQGQVFTKDYITTVNITVSSLAKAYNVLPNMLTSNFEIGVETTPKWVAATPTAVELE